jgi:hypothetical protein
LKDVGPKSRRRTPALKTGHIAGLLVFLELIHNLTNAANSFDRPKQTLDFSLQDGASQRDNSVVRRD